MGEQTCEQGITLTKTQKRKNSINETTQQQPTNQTDKLTHTHTNKQARKQKGK